jgi:hypothetical protein
MATIEIPTLSMGPVDRWPPRRRSNDSSSESETDSPAPRSHGGVLPM